MSLQSIITASLPLFQASDWSAAARSVELMMQTVDEQPGIFTDVNDVGDRPVPSPNGLEEIIAAQPSTPLLDELVGTLDHLVWYGSGRAISAAYSTLVGPGCPYESQALRFGLFFLPRDFTYAAHIHGADEIYVPIAGSGEWAYDLQAFEPRPLNSVVPIKSMRPHALRTTDQPVLMLYTWTGDITFDRYAFCN